MNRPLTKVPLRYGSAFRTLTRMNNEEAPQEDCSTAPYLYTHTYIRGKCVTCGAPQSQEEIFMETEPHE